MMFLSDANDIESALKDKAVLILADTPFQLLAAYSIAECLNGNAKKITLVIDARFDGYGSIVSRVDELGVFDNVLCCSKYPEYNNKTTLVILREAIKRREHASKRFFEKYPELKNCQYDVLMTSYPTLKAFDAKQCVVKNGYTLFFDDGSGSRNGNVFSPLCCMDDVFCNKRISAKQVIKRILGNPFASLFKLEIRGVFLFSPSSKEQHKYKVPVFSIPIPHDKYDLFNIFNKKNELMQVPKVVFFTLPDDVGDDLLNKEAVLIKEIYREFSDSFAIKVHPRRNYHDSRFSSIPCLPLDMMWEIFLLCGGVNEDSILFGCGSTAQLTPKMLCDIEPVIVFLHGYLPVNKTMDISINAMVADIKRDYDVQDKVFTPVDDEGLRLVIRDIKNFNGDLND